MNIPDNILNKWLQQAKYTEVTGFGYPDLIMLIEELQQWRERYMDQEMQRFAEIENAE